MGEAIWRMWYLSHTVKISKGWDDKKRHSKEKVQSEEDTDRRKIRNSLERSKQFKWWQRGVWILSEVIWLRQAGTYTVGMQAMTSKADCVPWAMGSYQPLMVHSPVIVIMPLGQVSHSCHFVLISSLRAGGDRYYIFIYRWKNRPKTAQPPIPELEIVSSVNSVGWTRSSLTSPPPFCISQVFTQQCCITNGSQDSVAYNNEYVYF